jgi:hypothetical protein
MVVDCGDEAAKKDQSNRTSDAGFRLVSQK